MALILGILKGFLVLISTMQKEEREIPQTEHYNENCIFWHVKLNMCYFPFLKVTCSVEKEG